MYKVGDKLICKKEYHPRFSGYNFIKEFLIGCEYQVFEISGGSIRLGNNSGYYCSGYYWFNDYDVSDFFYSVQELRKKKLERLNNV